VARQQGNELFTAMPTPDITRTQHGLHDFGTNEAACLSVAVQIVEVLEMINID
jgi:hypothetical protein